MAGLAGPALAGRTNFGSHFVSKNHLLNSFGNTRISFHCAFSCAIAAGKTCRKLGTARNSIEAGQAISAVLPQSAIVSGQVETKDAEGISTPGVKWAQVAVQGPRSEMEDDIVLRMDELNGFAYAAVFDGHAGFSTVKFLREELYKECVEALQSGLLLESGDFNMMQNAIAQAFLQADNRLLSWLEETGHELQSGSTATVMFLRSDRMIVAHVGDSRAVISRSGKAEIVTADHRPFGSSKTASAEIKRIKQAGGWVGCYHLHDGLQINNGRVCGILAVSRAFGDRELKTWRHKMLAEGVAERRWTEKFVSRIEFNGDWITAFPDVYQTNLNDAEFIIMASDGLWDCISSSDAVLIVRNQLCEHGDAQRACEALANAALERNAHDNISIVVADLGLQQHGRIEEQNFGSELGQAMLTVSVVVLGVMLSQFARNWAF